MRKYLDWEGLEYLCGKIKTDLDGKQNQLSGQPGQLVGFCGGGISALDITAGDNVKLTQLDSELEIGVNMDNGAVSGDVALLDSLIKQGTYTWLDKDGEMGTAGGLWNVVVSRSDYGMVYPSVTQLLCGTYGAKTKGRILSRAYYYANTPNWTPWRELVSLDQMTSPNLLDNWYFPDPINQRGQREYLSAGYTIDRWMITGAGSIKIQDDGILIQKDPGAAYITFESHIEDSRISASETITISAIVDGALVSATGKIKSGVAASGFSSGILDRMEVCDFSSTPGIHTIRLVIVSEQPHLLQAAKLEAGSVQTLAHQDTAGNWVLNGPPPDKALELAKCQRYLQVLMYGGYDELYAGYGGAVNGVAYVIVPFQLKYPIRANPTLVTGYMHVDKVRIIGRSLSTYLLDLGRDLASMSLVMSTKNQMIVRCNPSNTSVFPENHVFEIDALSCPTGEVLLASAEL